MVDINLNAGAAASFKPITIIKLLARLAAIEGRAKNGLLVHQVRLKRATSLSDDGADSIHVLERSLSGGKLSYHEAEIRRLTLAAENAVTKESRNENLNEANRHNREFHQFRKELAASLEFQRQLHLHTAQRAKDVEELRLEIERIEEFIGDVRAATSGVNKMRIRFRATGWLRPDAEGPDFLVRDLGDCLTLFSEGQTAQDAEMMERSRFTRAGEPIGPDLLLSFDDEDDDEGGGEGGEPELTPLW